MSRESSHLLEDSTSHGSQETSHESQEVDLHQPTVVYKRRYYVLAAFSLFSFCQGWIWNTFGPIQGAVEHVFGWNDSTIALLANWGPITYIATVTLFSWLLNVKGLRWAVLLSSALVAVGAGIRCISMEQTTATWLNHIGLILNGMAGPIAKASPSVISAVWFPPKQRTTATAVTAMSNYYGVALSFVFGPLLVSTYKTVNMTAVLEINVTSNLSTSLNSSSNHTVYISKDNLDSLRNQVAFYQYLEAAGAGAAFLLVLCYFPRKPPIPPSISAGCKRIGFVQGLRELLTHGRFWHIGIVYGICVGVFSGWTSVLDVNLKHFSIGENEAGWIGFYSVVAGSIAALIFSRITDLIQHRTKTVLVLVLVGATAAFTCFYLVCLKLISASKVSLYLSAIMGGVFVNGAIPLFYELAIETTYPIPEDAAMGLLTLLNSVGASIFLLLPMFAELKDTVADWMNPTMAASCFICVPVMLLFKAQYRRWSVDKKA